MDLETMICPRRKLEDTEMYVDKVTVYESDLGLEAMKFHVGEKFELFGTPVEGATETIIEFTAESRLVGFTGIASFTGIKGVQLSSIDRNCTKLAEEQAKKQEQYDTALVVKVAET